MCAPNTDALSCPRSPLTDEKGDQSEVGADAIIGSHTVWISNMWMTPEGISRHLRLGWCHEGPKLLLTGWCYSKLDTTWASNYNKYSNFYYQFLSPAAFKPSNSCKTSFTLDDKYIATRLRAF